MQSGILYKQIQVAREVFRAYDIRGIINDHFSENAFYSIGKAISCRLQALNRNKIFLARDGRVTSFQLASALEQGLFDSGINVINLGMIPTPVMYYATVTQKVDSGVMVTGSHNASDYNGIKMVIAGTTLANEDIDTLYHLNHTRQCISGHGELSHYDIIPSYIQRIISDIQIERKMKVVVDCGNGVAGPLVPAVLTKLGCEVIPLFCEVDGRFPNHHPDPTIESNLYDLKKTISEHEADLGLAFDGDGDRLGVVTNKGELIWPDRLMMMYSRELLKKHPGSTIVFDVKCSSHLERLIQREGGIAKMCPTGHSLVKAFMKKENAALAGEMSGHLFFKNRWFGFDDALYSACRLLEILSNSSESVSSQFGTIPNSLNTPEIKIMLEEDKKFIFMKQFIEKAKFETGQIISIDGLRVEFENGWGLLRASNTTPCLVTRFEADNEQSLKDIQALFKIQLLEIDENLDIPF